jgi:transcriptional regulator with XRE-family HTH domain
LKLSRLKEVRELHGWSQKRLAEESGVSRDSISNYETSQREAWPATAKRLADALGVEIADLRAPTREPALPKAEAPEAGQDSAEQAGFVEAVASGVDSLTDRMQTRFEKINHSDVPALEALMLESWLASRGAKQILEETKQEATQQRRETSAERQARAKLERAVMRLSDLAEDILSKLLEDTAGKELEGTEERVEVVRLDEERLRRRAG